MMNTKEKKKLRKKYLHKIETMIDMDIDPENIDTLEEIKMYVEVSDFRLFYQMHITYGWPILKKNYSKYLNMKSLINNVVLSREVTLKKLGI